MHIHAQSKWNTLSWATTYVWGTRTSRAPAGHRFSAVTPLGSFLTIHHTGLCELGCCKNGCLPAPAIGVVAPLARRPSQACSLASCISSSAKMARASLASQCPSDAVRCPSGDVLYGKMRLPAWPPKAAVVAVVAVVALAAVVATVVVVVVVVVVVGASS